MSCLRYKEDVLATAAKPASTVGALLAAMAMLGSSGCGDLAKGASPEGSRAKTSSSAATAASPEAEQQHRQRVARQYPLVGEVTGVQLVVRKEPDPEALTVGWLRMGASVRLKKKPVQTATCHSGWYEVYPRGWVCSGQGVEAKPGSKSPEQLGASPVEAEPLPYTYYYVKEPMVPEYHRLPSRDEQRAARAFAREYLKILDKNEGRAARFRKGELPGQIHSPAVVHRYLERGFFVASTGIEVRAFRRFTRTVRGSYVKEARLQRREGSSFHGVELGERHSLPLAFTVRTARPMLKRERDDGSVQFIEDEEAEPIERQTLLEQWQGTRNLGGRVVHVLQTDQGERYLRSWFAAVAKKVDLPEGVDKDEPWIHVHRDQQTLVAYRGETPVYATLVSTGLEGYETPLGVFDIHKKFVADTMANLGPDAGDERYRVDDVPWTQYFEGANALHGAFWHDRFGLPRSHGCVNLAPIDAQKMFETTLPEVPEGWHGAATDRSGFSAGKVVVTE